MKKLLPLLVLAAICSIFATCKKDDTTSDKLYFKAKVNGQDYVPNNCANCLKMQILRDSVLLFNANAGYESLGLGVNEASGIQPKIYSMNGIVIGSAYYDNSPQVNDIFKTDVNHTGQLSITEVDRTKKTIRGTFFFKAFNSVHNTEVNVTEGAFHLNYTTN